MLETLPLTPLTALYAGSAGSSFGGPLATAYPAETVSPAATSAMNRFLISLILLVPSHVRVPSRGFGQVTAVLRDCYDSSLGS